MPWIEESKYQPQGWLQNAHIQTITPTLFRKIGGVRYERENLDTPDGDFVTLDWSFAEEPTQDLVILSHGLEGDSESSYVKGMARLCNQNQMDVIARNFRGCGGKLNRLLRFYHSGETEDLFHIIDYVSKNEKYKSIHLIGFSMGGNQTLKLLGEYSQDISSKVKTAVCFSVPCDLNSCAHRLNQWSNKIYLERFLIQLKSKIKQKQRYYPKDLNTEGMFWIRNFHDFDDRYTAPLHGFRDAEHYYDRSSSKHYLLKIEIPTLMINATDDPFLTPECYPTQLAQNHPILTIETPKHGGHVGFMQNLSWQALKKPFWSEQRAIEFINQTKK